MKFTNTTVTELLFSVESFWPEEGGMGHEQYGEQISEMTQAIRIYELACIAKPKTDWKIVVNVSIITK